MNSTTSALVATSSSAELFDCRDAFSQTLMALAEQDSRVCAVVNDSVSSTKLKPAAWSLRSC